MTSPPIPRLTAIPFDSEITKLTERFKGREWVFEIIDNWLKQKDERFFVLTGEPGVGKSAIAARLTQTHQNIAAYHFCIAGQSGTIQPNGVLLSLAAQLVEYFPDYAETLTNVIKPLRLSVKAEINAQTIKDSSVRGIVIENLHTQSPKETLDIVLHQSLAKLPNPPEQPVLILIDSLDEAVTYGDQENLVTLLSSVNDLPVWVRLIVTTRPDEQRVLSYLKTLKPYFYNLELSQKSLEDVHAYVGERIVSETIEARLLSCQTESQSLVEHITELSKGNFLYVKALVDDIESGGQPLDDLDALPKSLDEFYHNFLMRHRSLWEAKYQIIFGILTVTKAPVTKKELINFIANNPVIKQAPSETELNQALGVVKQFFTCQRNDYGQDTYILFHQSLRDYLLDQNRNPDFWCSPKDGNRWIVKYCWQFHPNDWRGCDLYGLRHLASHLVTLADLEKMPQESKKYTEILHELMATETQDEQNVWFTVKEGSGDLIGFFDDINIAWQLAESENDLVRQVQYALFKASASNLVGNLPAALIGKLLEHKIWSPQLALRVAKETTDEDYKALTLEKIAPQLLPELFSEAHQIARTMNSPSDQAKTLGVLSHFAPIPLFENIAADALNALHGVKYDSDRAFCIKYIAVHVPDSALSKLLSIVLSLPFTDAKADALAALLPRLPDNLLLGLSAEFDDLHLRSPEVVLALQKLAERLPAQEANKMWEKALDLSLSFIDKDRADSLDKLVPKLPESLLPKAFEKAHNLNLNHPVEIAALLMRCSKTEDREYLLKQGLDGIEQLGYGTDPTRVRHLAKLMRSLFPQERSPVYQKALAEAQKNDYHTGRAIGLALLIPWAEEHEQDCFRREVIQQLHERDNSLRRAEAIAEVTPYLLPSHLPEILKIACSIEEEEDRVRALVGIAPYLPPDLLHNALIATADVHNNDHRFEIIKGLAPYLSADLLSQAVVKARSIRDKDQQLRATIELAMQIPPEECPAGSAELLTMATKINSSLDRVKTFHLLVGWLPEQLRSDAWNHLISSLKECSGFELFSALSAIASNLSEAKINRLLEVINGRSSSEKDDALRCLAPVLPESYLPKLIELAWNQSSLTWQAEKLIPILPRLSEEEQANLLRRLLNNILGAKNDCASVIELIAPYLSGNLLSETFNLAQTLPKPYGECAKALIALLPKLMGQEKVSAIKSILDAAQQSVNAVDRARSLSMVVPYMAEHQQTQVSDEALNACRKVPLPSDRLEILVELAPWKLSDPNWETLFHETYNQSYAHWRARTLIRLIPFIPESKRSDYLTRSLIEGGKWSLFGERAKAWEGLLEFWMGLPQMDAQSTWQRSLRVLASRERGELLLDLGFLAPIVKHLVIPDPLSVQCRQ
jgi:hypothetical protein